MSAHSTGYLFAEQSTCSAAGFPASRGAMPGASLAQKTLATSGRNTLESFGRFSRVSSWAKTFAACLVGEGEFNSRLCVLTWKLKATTFSRFYFQLSASVPYTKEIGSGLWPTPAACNPNDGEGAETWLARAALLKEKHKNGNGVGMPLAIYVQLLPTPDASLASGGKTRSLETSITGRKPDGGKAQITLSDYAKRGLLSDARGPLNPRFVLQLMGFPADWCDLTEAES